MKTQRPSFRHSSFGKESFHGGGATLKSRSGFYIGCTCFYEAVSAGEEAELLR